MSPETRRYCVQLIKGLANARVPAYEMPADSFIEDAVDAIEHAIELEEKDPWIIENGQPIKYKDQYFFKLSKWAEEHGIPAISGYINGSGEYGTVEQYRAFTGLENALAALPEKK